MVSVRGSFALLISIRTIGGVKQSISKSRLSHCSNTSRRLCTRDDSHAR